MSDRERLLSMASTLRAQAAICEEMAGEKEIYKRPSRRHRTQVKTELLLAAVDERRRAAGLSWRQLAGDLGLSPSLFARLRRGAGVELDAFATLVTWMAVPAETFFS